MPEGELVNLDGLVGAIERRVTGSRLLVAIAGPPGAGKSTLADALVARLDAGARGSAAILPMDGFHYDDRVLLDRGLRQRKGAPETFDVGGLAHMLLRLRRNDEDEIAVPVFDRDLEISRAGARLIPRSVRVIVVEGNYFLLDRHPWSGLRAMFDISVMVAVTEAVLRRRLADRWRGYGLTPDDIEAKLESNDLPNGRFVASGSSAPDFVLTN